jgi:AhpC/TSA family
MAQLRLNYQEFQKRDTEVLQITCSTPEEAQLYFQQYQLLFPYLCDPERAVYRLYGVPLLQRGLFERIQTVAASMTVEVSDRLLRGERSASPAPYIKRYGSTVPDQALLIVDKAGIIRYVHTAGPIGGLPSNAEHFRQLDRLQ